MRLGRTAPAALLALAGLALAGCDATGDEGPDSPDQPDRPAEPLVHFDTAAVSIHTTADSLQVPVELALTPEQRAYGLMERPSLPAEQGMLFVYPEPQDSSAGFWMYRTLIPLDIAFLDDDGRILAIRPMAPCGSPNPRVCRWYGPGVPFSAALEVNRGFFARHGIGAGDRVDWAGIEAR